VPTNRTPISRPHRPRFTNEALALLAELERVPAHRRRSRVFRDAEHELARQLHLVAEYWTGNNVTDKSSEPCNPPGAIARADWIRCRAVRKQVLQAIENL
jgi:hypothetical protein